MNKKGVSTIILCGFFFMVFVGLVVAVISAMDSKKEDNSPKEKTVFSQNTIFDGSRTDAIKICREYLMSRLKDPDSYVAGEWEQLQSTDKGYTLQHSYRSKNSYNGYSAETVVFFMDNKGKIYDMVKRQN